MLAAASTLGVARARAADELVLANAHLAGYPRIELSVDAPGGAAGLHPADVTVTEDGQPVEALVDRLAGEGLEVMLVVDTSSAVGTDALAAAQAATTRLVDRMPGGVRVGLVAFGPEVRLLAAPTDARAAVGASIEALAGGGGPGADAPMYDAVVAASRAFDAGARERMIVLFDAAGDVGSAVTVEGAAAAVAGLHVEVVSLETAATSPLALARLAIEGRGDVRSAGDAARIGAAFDSVADAIVGRYSIAYTSRGHGTVEVRVVTPIGELRSRLELPPAAASGPPTAPSSPPTIAPSIAPTTVAPTTVAPTTVAARVEASSREVGAIPAVPQANESPDDAGPRGGPLWTTIEALALGGLVLIVALRHLRARRVEAIEMPVVDAHRWPPPLPDQVLHHPCPTAFAHRDDGSESEPELTGAR